MNPSTYVHKWELEYICYMQPELSMSVQCFGRDAGKMMLLKSKSHDIFDLNRVHMWRFRTLGTDRPPIARLHTHTAPQLHQQGRASSRGSSGCCIMPRNTPTLGSHVLPTLSEYRRICNEDAAMTDKRATAQRYLSLLWRRLLQVVLSLFEPTPPLPLSLDYLSQPWMVSVAASVS